MPLNFSRTAGVPLAKVKDLLSPRYRVQRELGRGGMATVFLATDLAQGGEVAIKILHPSLAATLGPARFRREIDILRRLHHPNIPPLLDAGEQGSLMFFTTPYSPGRTLRALIRGGGPLPLPQVLAITRDVAGAVDHAHRQNILHRDIKPGNIMIEGDRTLVFDFGVARFIEQTGVEALTLGGMILGTPEYMSPEQAEGESLDARSDIYALGCVVYEMLSGEQPFTGPNPDAVFARQIADPPRSIRARRPEVPEAMEAAVFRAMAKQPGQRPGSGLEFVRLMEKGNGER
jgi:serine/threonine protein kinase